MKVATIQHLRARSVGLLGEYLFRGIKHFFRFRPRASGEAQIDLEQIQP